MRGQLDEVVSAIQPLMGSSPRKPWHRRRVPRVSGRAVAAAWTFGLSAFFVPQAEYIAVVFVACPALTTLWLMNRHGALDALERGQTRRQMLRDAALTLLSFAVWPVIPLLGAVAITRRLRRGQQLLGWRDLRWFARRAVLGASALLTLWAIGTSPTSSASRSPLPAKRRQRTAECRARPQPRGTPRAAVLPATRVCESGSALLLPS